MFLKNPWETAIHALTESGEADLLSTTSMNVLNRLSEKANPVTGICLLDVDAFAKEVEREGEQLTKDLVELIRGRVIRKRICLDHAVITVHDRFKRHEAA